MERNYQLMILALIWLAVGLAGCATTKTWSATGGSRSDGVIKLSYEYGLFEVPQVNEQQALELATTRCIAWGYSGSEAFGGQTQVCNNVSSGGCNRWLVTREYQCLGSLEKSHEPAPKSAEPNVKVIERVIIRETGEGAPEGSRKDTRIDKYGDLHM